MCCSPSESEEEAPVGLNKHAHAPSLTVFNFTCKRSSKEDRNTRFTFDIDLSWRGVSAIEIRSEAGVASGVFLEGLGDDQRVQLAVGDDLNVRAVLQLLALTKPPAIKQRTW